jgi:hypothetical protein
MIGEKYEKIEKINLQTTYEKFIDKLNYIKNWSKIVNSQRKQSLKRH